MTTNDKTQIVCMRKAGAGYGVIAQKLGLSVNTVKTFCRRNHLTQNDLAQPEAQTPAAENAVLMTVEPSVKTCLQCGTAVVQTPGRKEKKFCCDSCRNKWWNSHLSQVKRKAMYEYSCPTCGISFHAYGHRHRKYCSHECYIKSRFGGVQS